MSESIDSQDEEVTEFQLSTSIDVNGQEVSTLKLRLANIKAKHMRVMDGSKGEIDASIKFLARVSGIPVKFLEEISASDFIALNELIAPFLGPSPETGRT